MLITVIGSSTLRGSQNWTAVWKNLSIWTRVLTSTVTVFFKLIGKMSQPRQHQRAHLLPGSRPGGEAGRAGERLDRQAVSRDEANVSGPGSGSLRKLQHHSLSEVILSSDLKVILPAELRPWLPQGIVERKS